jgi:hypothetical protein
MPFGILFLYYLGVEAGVKQLCALRLQVFELACLDSAFAIIVNN